MPNKDLPIWKLHEEILGALNSGSRLALMAPTGSGKTTQIPQMLLQSSIGAQEGKIFVLEPRRVAARNVAMRVSFELNSTPGKLVGYQVRFDDQTSPDTKIIFMTEGVFLRHLASNPILQGVSCVIFDEFHERNIGSDTALALTKRIQNQGRGDINIVVMSATLESDKVSTYLDNCPNLKAEGRQFPVDIKYLDYMNQTSSLFALVSDAVQDICLQQDPGDILVFMPGMGEIHQTIRELQRLKISEPLDLIPLHGELPVAEQDRAFAPSKNNRRKVIVSTNVAETSVTIEGITHVIDSGLARVARYCPERGINILELQPICQASADQRTGRAGRLGPGTCLRLWTESGQLNRIKKQIPEIQRADFTDTLLLLKHLEIPENETLDWLDAPSEESFSRSYSLLIDLGAIDQKTSKITPVGRVMQKLPTAPRLARILIAASKSECFLQAVLCAALLTEREILIPIKKGGSTEILKRRNSLAEAQSSDFLLAIRAFEFAWRNRYSVEQCSIYGIHAQAAKTVELIFKKLLQNCYSIGLGQNAKTNIDSLESVFDISPSQLIDLRRIMLAGFLDHLARRVDQGTLKCVLSDNSIAEIGSESLVHESPILFYGAIRQSKSSQLQSYPKMTMNTQVEVEWIKSDYPDQVKQVQIGEYIPHLKRVECFEVLNYRKLELSKLRIENSDPMISGFALANAAAEEKFPLPKWNHQLEQTIARFNLVALSIPELELLPIERKEKIEILSKAFQGIHLAKEAQNVEILRHLMDWIAKDTWEWIDEMAPVKIYIINEKPIKLVYTDPLKSGSKELIGPVAQINLLDCFELDEHPTVLEDRIPILLRLLTPDGKKLSETENWKRFKIKEYPMQKASLKSKYPGKFWP